MRVAIIGAALSANKGAAAMLETVIARQPGVSGPCTFDILTTYPQADAPLVPAGAGARVIGLQPMRLALVEFPVAVLARAARFARLPLGWVRARASRALLDADVVVDVAGISFADGRGVPITVYNALMTGLPLLLGTPTVKAAQALGPFANPVNRTLARLVLPRLSAVCARGARTRGHLDSLGLHNVTDVADLAFSLDEAADLPAGVESAVSAVRSGYAVVMPSSVVRRLFESSGGDYVAAVAAVVRGVRERTGLGVVVAPHSYRTGHPEGRMNDGPVCREVAAVLAGDPGVVGIDAPLTAGELRRLVAGSRVLLTSRFHAMISGLATCTPTVVVGWSHKYREVLDDFGLTGLGMDSAVLADPHVVVDAVVECVGRHDEIAATIRAALPAVREKSMRNFEVIHRAGAGAAA
jgi:polysaccharide pyruvyl transferase WcaK-like protein